MLDEDDYELWELWELLNIKEVLNRNALKLILTYCNGQFSLSSKEDLKHDIAPAWFKANMFCKKPISYENDQFKVIYLNNNLEINSSIDYHSPTFSGNENIPYYYFKLNIKSNSWEGLLEKWAQLSFDWLELHEDSTKYQ